MQNTKVHENPFEKKKNMDFFEHSPILEEKKEKLGFPEKDQDNIKFWTSVQTVEREEDKNSDIDLNQFEDFEDVPASEGKNYYLSIKIILSQKILKIQLNSFTLHFPLSPISK